MGGLPKCTPNARRSGPDAYGEPEPHTPTHFILADRQRLRFRAFHNWNDSRWLSPRRTLMASVKNRATCMFESTCRPERKLCRTQGEVLALPRLLLDHANVGSRHTETDGHH